MTTSHRDLMIHRTLSALSIDWIEKSKMTLWMQSVARSWPLPTQLILMHRNPTAVVDKMPRGLAG
jgi:hypothetical protein